MNNKQKWFNNFYVFTLFTISFLTVLIIIYKIVIFEKAHELIFSQITSIFVIAVMGALLFIPFCLGYIFFVTSGKQRFTTSILIAILLITIEMGLVTLMRAFKIAEFSLDVSTVASYNPTEECLVRNVVEKKDNSWLAVFLILEIQKPGLYYFQPLINSNVNPDYKITLEQAHLHNQPIDLTKRHFCRAGTYTLGLKYRLTPKNKTKPRPFEKERGKPLNPMKISLVFQYNQNAYSAALESRTGKTFAYDTKKYF